MASGSEKGQGSFGSSAFMQQAPKPFRVGNWEVVSGLPQPGGFSSLELPVIELKQGDSLFERFDQPLDPDSTVVWHASEGVEEKLALRKRIKQLEQEVVSTSQKARDEGYAKGKVEGDAHYKAELESMRKASDERIVAIEQELKGQITNALEAVEKDAVKLALQIAGRIIPEAASAKPEYIFQVVKGALANVKGAQVLKVRVSPEDYEFLSLVARPGDMSSEELGITYVSDENITGGCVIETDFGLVDAQLDTMWNQVKDKIFEVI